MAEVIIPSALFFSAISNFEIMELDLLVSILTKYVCLNFLIEHWGYKLYCTQPLAFYSIIHSGVQ